MNLDNTTLVILIIAIVVLAIFLWIRAKKSATTLKHDNAIAFVGGIGSGKTMLSVKTAIKEIKRRQSKWKRDCFWHKVYNNYFLGIVKLFNKNAKPISDSECPWLYNNGGGIWWGFGKNKKWSRRLTKEHFIFATRIPIGSVVLIDECSELVNNANFGLPFVRDQLDEWFRMFRHYIDGLLIVNAQSLDEIVVQVRRKLNVYYWLFDRQSIWKFWRVRCLRNRVGDTSVSNTEQFIEDNARWVYGTFFFPHYDSRAYRHRYDCVTKYGDVGFEEMTTNEVLRLDGRTSFLDSEVKKDGSDND